MDSRWSLIFALGALVCGCDLEDATADREARVSAPAIASFAAPPPAPSGSDAKVQPVAPPRPAASTALAEAAREYERAPIETTVDGTGNGPYEFKAKWHTSVIESWREHLLPLAGRADLRYLEIGVFEGRSLIWMLENVLTHDGSRATAADLFLDFYAPRFERNLAASGAADKVEILKGPSPQTLRTLTDVAYDVIYIDGSHTAAGVLADVVLSWDVLKVGGLLVLDDYDWPGRNHGIPIAAELRPKVAIDAFITAHRNELEIIERGTQVIARRLPNRCGEATHCSPIGEYLYAWNTGELTGRDGRPVSLTETERTFLEYVLVSRKFGQVDFTFKPALRDAPELEALVSRLGLELKQTAPPPDTAAGR